MSDTVLLSALDGSNPLAFLAAVGTLRLLHLSRPDTRVRMNWGRCDGLWKPTLQGLNTDEDGLCELLVQARWAPVEKFEQIGLNLTVSSQQFSAFVREACKCATRFDRRAADFSAAFGCESCEDKRKSRIDYTDLCFITGSGHQDFLGTISGLATSVMAAHIRDALFGNWRADKGLSMRWDPSDAAEYALRWNDPGPRGAWAVWGANRLAVEALPVFPTLPGRRTLQTTSFRFNARDRWKEFTWPIWTQLAGLGAIRSLVSLAELQQETPDRAVLGGIGIAGVFRAQRVRIGQGANFKVSFRSACGI